VGWGLLGWALLVVCVALPAWALAAGDVNVVAGWANILALPVTALGVVLVLADRDRTRARAVPGAADGRRRPWMAPPVDRMVDRPELAGWLLPALTGPAPAEVGLTTGLAGAGGFGKTRLASWVCHRPEVDRRYPGGLLWVTVGQEVRGADLAERVNDLSFVLSGQRPAISDPDTAGAELGRLLDARREPVLLVVDDVWEEAQLRPFRFGGRACTRLVTTRVPDLLPAGGRQLRVDAMSGDQARELVADGVAGLAVDAADRLARLAGRWPVLLNLLNGVLRRRVAAGQPPGQAAEEVAGRLAAGGPAVFDPARPGDRSRAVAATMDASLSLLTPADRERYVDLAVFAEDVDIPLDVLTLLWPGCPPDTLCAELAGLGLVADYRFDRPGPRLVLHDVIRGYLRARRTEADRAGVHRRLVEAAAELLPADDADGPRPWWLLPASAGYLYRHLPYHLQQAGGSGELAELACDLRWVEAKTRRYGSVVAALADLDLAHTPTAALLRDTLGQAARLLGPIDPPAALGATLASRLHNVPGLQAVLDRYRATLPRPRLEPAWPLPDQPQPPTQTGHAGGVTGCAFSPDATLLATTSDDGTVRLWRLPDGTEQAVLTGHTGGVHSCAFSPDGALLATTSDDGTARLWHVADGTTAAVLTGHDGWVTSCGFSPDGTLLATTGVDETARLWKVADGCEITMLAGHPGGTRGCAFSPDGAVLATAGLDGTVRLWPIAGGAAAILTDHTSGVWSCAFSPDGTLLASGSDDGMARLCRVADGSEVAVLGGHTGGVTGCAFSPDGTLLATSSDDGTARLWQVRGGAERGVLTGHTGSVTGCAFSPDGGLLASGGIDQTVRLWQVGSGAPRAVLRGHAGLVDGCAFSPDGTLLASSSVDGTARLWNTPDGTERAVLTGHAEGLNDCAFSPDGALLATASCDRTVRLWQVPDGVERVVLTSHTSCVLDCAFSPDGALLATASNDRTVRLWQVATGRCRCALRVAGPLLGIAWHPAGSMLCTVGGAGVYLLAYQP